MVSLRDVMTRDVHTTTTEATIADAANEMVGRRIGSTLVTTKSTLVGILTERDVLRAAGAGGDLAQQSVRDWMTADPVTAEPDLDVGDATEAMLAGGFRHLPVMDGPTLVGVVSLRDLLSSRIHQA